MLGVVAGDVVEVGSDVLAVAESLVGRLPIDRVADLQYRDRYEYAVGHNVAVEVPTGQEHVRRLRTTWLPRACSA